MNRFAILAIVVVAFLGIGFVAQRQAAVGESLRPRAEAIIAATLVPATRGLHGVEAQYAYRNHDRRIVVTGTAATEADKKTVTALLESTGFPYRNDLLILQTYSTGIGGSLPNPGSMPGTAGYR